MPCVVLSADDPRNTRLFGNRSAHETRLNEVRVKDCWSDLLENRDKAATGGDRLFDSVGKIEDPDVAGDRTQKRPLSPETDERGSHLSPEVSECRRDSSLGSSKRHRIY